MVDTVAILSTIWARNALRREAHLPLWPVRETYEREIRQARWSAHVAANAGDVRERIVARLRAEKGPGWGYSAGARW